MRVAANTTASIFNRFFFQLRPLASPNIMIEQVNCNAQT
jgi:hypothetical protein